MSDGDRRGGDERTDDDGADDDAPEDDPFGDALFDERSGDEGWSDDADEGWGDDADDAFGASDTDEVGGPVDDPFAELDADADGATAGEDPFESMGTGEVGDEDVWEALDEETSVGGDGTAFDDAATGSAGPTPGAEGVGGEVVVDKRSYCQRCPHFASPPETACTHEGTDIVESVDFSRFRVRNCPMVDADDPAFDGE